MSRNGTLHDVLIVGAGPTGLSLANTCRRFGLPVRIIDRAPQASQVSKALAVWSGSLEAFEAMGVIDRFLAHGVRMHGVKMGDGTQLLAQLTAGEGVDSPYPFPILLPQSETERLLYERLVELGGDVERGLELTGLVQDAEGVTATLRSADGREETTRVSYLVGCDGARSVTRHQLQVPFEGYTEEKTFVLCDAKIDGDLDRTCIYVWWNNGGSVALFPVRDEVWRLFALREEGGDGVDPPTLEEMQHKITAHGPPNLQLRDPTWLSAFRINERLAAHYRVGRCFLAGDAAHVHSPAGGQGMNTGIQDGVNLGWKLALALQGLSGREALLGSYEAERRPVAREVVEGAGQMLHVAFGNNPLLHLAKDVVIPLLAHIPLLKRKLQVRLSETEIVYREGPLVLLGGAEAYTGCCAVGSRALDATLHDTATGGSQRLWPLLSGPYHTLLLFGDPAKLPEVSQAGASVGDRIKIIVIDASSDPDGKVRARYGIETTGWVLIRPDHVVAARGEEDDTAYLDTYVEGVLQSSPS